MTIRPTRRWQAVEKRIDTNCKSQLAGETFFCFASKLAPITSSNHARAIQLVFGKMNVQRADDFIDPRNCRF